MPGEDSPSREVSVRDLDALLAAPVVGALSCEGCTAEVEVRDGPAAAVQEGVRVFAAAHARCISGGKSAVVLLQREPDGR